MCITRQDFYQIISKMGGQIKREAKKNGEMAHKIFRLKIPKRKKGKIRVSSL